jgi:DNA repair protein RecN (Recombination protein N)
MLTELRISNFAVIDRLAFECTAGFTVLTGETGAGKSILVDALALLVGGRASNDQIRSDADEAVVEAAFTLFETGPLAARLREEGLLGAGETELLVRRVLSRSGRNRIYVNGNLTPLHLLQTLGGTLIDIHGQHEQQSLLSAQAQLDALDGFGRLKDLRATYAEAYDRWRALQRELEETQRVAADRQAREDFLRFQHRELEEADIRPGEDEVLVQERHRLMHAQRLGESAGLAYDLLYGEEASILGALGQVNANLKEIRAVDPQAGEWASYCDDAVVQLQELARRLRDYRQGLEQDPARLTEVEERLDRLQRLKKKHGGSLEAVLTRRQELREEIEALTTGEVRAAELIEAAGLARAGLEGLAERLSEGRRRAAAKMEVKITEELVALRMGHTRFHITVSREPGEEALRPAGTDRVEYLLSANQGEPLQPLARVASGGELSRVMLALKTVLAETDRVPVLVFDEVDAGIGGAVASAMGKRLKELADYHQVFCVTHLPQIASQAGTHFAVEKSVVKKRTVVRARRLGREERQEEIARMLGGVVITQAVRDTAAEMIGEAERGR